MVYSKRSLWLVPALIFVAAAAPAQVVIDIHGQADARIPVAVPPLLAQPGLEPLAEEVARVIAYDLAFSGLYVIVPPSGYPSGWTGLPPMPDQIKFEAWRATKAEQLVFGGLRLEGDTIVAELRLFDVFSGQQVVGRAVQASREFVRLIGHRFTEEVIRYVDGVAGIGTSEICFSGGAVGAKEIYVADYDGANMRRVTDHGSISIMPTMSPDGQRIAYLSYKDRYAFLYIYDRRTGQSVPLSKEVGLNAAPSWHPDGNRLAVVLSKDGNTEIYLRNADGSNPVRLTNNKFGDTSPAFSPDGGQIAFVSDRGGAPQIYVMRVDGSDQRRLSVQGGSSYDPEWSPDGKSIAYVVEKRGSGLQIHVMDAADGGNWRQLTNSPGSNEAPSWSPDSRHVLFTTTRNGRSELYTANVKTGEQQVVPNLGIRASGSSWGPRRD